MADVDQGRELVLAPNEQACVLDRTNGNVYLYVGPKQDAIGNSLTPVFFNEKTKTFERCDLSRAIQKLTIAPEGWYITLKNPAKDGKHPPQGQRSQMPELDTGRKINIPGPVAFATWPAQMVKVLPGHALRSNQYLLVRVYDQAQAREHWKDATIQTVEGKEEKPLGDVEAEQLTMGQLIVIRGTHVSFFIPPTGIEVVRDEMGNLVRDAVTLERLEYCQLLDENGNKRYVQGPAVVFPRPTEVFQTRKTTHKSEDGTPRSTRKFRAIELTPTSGIYVKVIAPYADETGEHDVEELFITGKDTPMYFPREEHAIIKYDDQEVHYATAIPAGEGRYVLDRLTGRVRTEAGPAMFLPDPRKEVILRRALDLKTCELLYPGNREALAYNAALLGVNLEEQTRGGVGSPGLFAAAGAAAAAAAPIEAMTMNAMYLGSNLGDAAIVSNSAEARGLGGEARVGFTGDRFQRKGRYSEPRTLTLNTKYAGAVTTSIWTGYAVMLVSKSGERRVVQGPRTVMLAYDEEPQVLTLSTGKPKTTDTLYRTVFLRTQANMVSDIVEVETKDFCKIHVKLSYRVNFEGEPTRWFAIENYVKFLTDHMRSRLRNGVRRYGAEEFYTNNEAIIRDIVLGKAVEPDSGKFKDRPGMTFEENGMRIYDVEILNVGMQNPEIEKLLVGQQREVMNHTLQLASARRTLDFTTKNEVIKRDKLDAEALTQKKEAELKTEEVARKLALDLSVLDANQTTETERAAAAKAKEEAESLLHGIRLARQKAAQEQEASYNDRLLEQRLKELEAEVEAVTKRGTAIKPDLIAALQSFGDQATLKAVAESMAPLGILGGGKKSVQQILAELLAGSPLAKHLLPATNGTSKSESQPRA